jgi:hypothetical protein
VRSANANPSRRHRLESQVGRERQLGLSTDLQSSRARRMRTISPSRPA